MAQHPIQKFFGLIVLYSVIILGISALQFRSQSIFSKNFEQLRLTLSKNKQAPEKKGYVDTFHITYKGITLYSDDKSKPILLLKNGTEKVLRFQDWTEINKESFKLSFDNDVSILCGVTSSDKSTLTLSVSLPTSANNVSLPYKFAKAYTVTNSSSRKITLKSNNMQTILTAPTIKNDFIVLTPVESTFTYANYKPVTHFSFDSITDNPLAQADTYMQNIKNIKSACTNLFNPSIENMTENSVIAYLAEMTMKNKYLDAIALIPDSYKNSLRRTYLSAPYLNNLVNMNTSLVMQMENTEYRMNYSLEKQNLSIFETDNLSQYLLTLNVADACQVLQLPSTLSSFEPTTLQACGILNTYSQLKNSYPEMANLLEPVLDSSLRVIEVNCKLENDKLFVIENNEKLNSIQTLKVGQALISYGAILKNNTVQSGGYFLVNSQISTNEQLDLRNASDFYTILEQENTFVPHILDISKSTSHIWAWTIAQNITFAQDEEKTITLGISFPLGASHYMIINNVEPFKSIEIYGMKFRTDPRFETYNSSGYVYNAKSKTLFLKCRQKSETEIVKLFYIEETLESEEIQADLSDSNATKTQDTTAVETTEAFISE